MNARLKKVLERITRPALTYLAPGAVILGYHRVSDSRWDPLNLAISRKNFRSQLEVIADRYSPVSLDTLMTMKWQGKSLRGHVAITFDDGCEDFVRNAMPELVAHKIPATIFVTTGYAGELFWWDEVSQLLKNASSELNEIEVDFGAGDASEIFEDLTNRESAGRAVREICDQLLDLEPSRRSEVIGRIRRQTAGEARSNGAPCAMTRQQLQQVSDNAMVEVAAHTVTHPMLSRLGRGEQEKEIQDSKSVLEALGNRVTGFSYPNGSYTASTTEIVRESGFDYACTSRQSAVRQKTNNYQLPRIWVPNMGGESFGGWISSWSGT